MSKKIITLIFILILIISTIVYLNYSRSDSIKFKNEYESINNKLTEDGKQIRKINIPKNNKIIYKTDKELVEMINNKESFVVYFGFAKCPWCRSMVPTLLEVVNDLKMEKIYYVDIFNIRDKIELTNNNELKKVNKGTKDYNKLLKLLDPVLEEYTITDNTGKKIDTKEKRIYAPNIVVIVNGKAKKLETGISDKLTDPYMKIDKEIKQDSYNKIKCALKCIEEENTCKKNICVK